MLVAYCDWNRLFALWKAGRPAGQYEDTYANTVQFITSKLDTLAELLTKDTVR